MAYVSINFEDTPEGEIHVRVVHHHGYREDSSAHKLSQQVLKFLDEQAEKKTILDVPETIIEPEPKRIIR